MMGHLRRKLIAFGIAFTLSGHSVALVGQAQAPMQDGSALIGKTVAIEGLLDENGRTVTLAPQPAEAGPLILAPIYARCPHTCSPLTLNLLRALQDAGSRLGTYRVASLSIDSNETPQNLQVFRQRLGLPAEWALVRVPDVGRLKALLAELRFVAVERSDGQFDHPNVVYVLSAEGVVSSVLPGLALTGADLVSAVEQARRGGMPWWRQYLFALAAFGLAASAWVFAVTWLRRLTSARTQGRKAEAVPLRR